MIKAVQARPFSLLLTGPSTGPAPTRVSLALLSFLLSDVYRKPPEPTRPYPFLSVKVR